MELIDVLAWRCSLLHDKESSEQSYSGVSEGPVVCWVRLAEFADEALEGVGARKNML
jgi:hypothetical protein